MNEVEKAILCFNKGYSCSQAILSTYGPKFGLEYNLAIRITGGFGGGIARLGYTCGAVSGAIMVLGLKYCPLKASDQKNKDKTYEMIRTFINKFNSIHGSIACRELLDCDISTPEGRLAALEKRLFQNLCPNLVRDSANILEELIKD